MCLIIASRSGILPSEDLLKVANHGNPHGWGVMWAEGGVVHADKGFLTDSLISNVRKHEGTPHVVHMRWATHGKVDIANTHPFKITKDLWMAHNGILNIATPNKDFSDSWHFAEELKAIIQDFPWMALPKHQARLLRYAEFACGWGNKIAFLRGNGEIFIAHEDKGTEHEGLWLSNDYSLPKGKDYFDYYYGSKYGTAWSDPFDFDAHSDSTELGEVTARSSQFVEDGDTVTVNPAVQCDFCDELHNMLVGFEGQLVCEECYEWAYQEKDLYDRYKRYEHVGTDAYEGYVNVGDDVAGI